MITSIAGEFNIAMHPLAVQQFLDFQCFVIGMLEAGVKGLSAAAVFQNKLFGNINIPHNISDC